MRGIRGLYAPTDEGCPTGQSHTVIEPARAFECKVIDDDPELLRQSYALRYQAYCVERALLPAERYPDRLETDSFDHCSVHVGVADAGGELLGTARLVRAEPAATALPLLRYCTLFPDHTELSEPMNRVIEVSRLATSRGGAIWAGRGGGRREVRRQVFQALLKGVYQTAKRLGATHWIAATERSLQRRVDDFGFPFRAIGPESDYSGPVTPYIVSLAEFDAVILSGRFPVLEDFLVGLEPRFQPDPGRSPHIHQVSQPPAFALQPCAGQA